MTSLKCTSLILFYRSTRANLIPGKSKNVVWNQTSWNWPVLNRKGLFWLRFVWVLQRDLSWLQPWAERKKHEKIRLRNFQCFLRWKKNEKTSTNRCLRPVRVLVRVSGWFRLVVPRSCAVALLTLVPPVHCPDTDSRTNAHWSAHASNITKHKTKYPEEREERTCEKTLT